MNPRTNIMHSMETKRNESKTHPKQQNNTSKPNYAMHSNLPNGINWRYSPCPRVIDEHAHRRKWRKKIVIALTHAHKTKFVFRNWITWVVGEDDIIVIIFKIQLKPSMIKFFNNFLFVNKWVAHDDIDAISGHIMT